MRVKKLHLEGEGGEMFEGSDTHQVLLHVIIYLLLCFQWLHLHVCDD